MIRAQPTHDLTPAQARALELMQANEGVIFSGDNLIKGGIFRVAHQTLRRLEAKGFCTVDHATDGGVIAKLAKARGEEVQP